MLHLFWDLQCWDDPKSNWRVTQCCSGSLSCAWGWCTKTWPFLSIASNWWAALVQRGSIHVHPNDLNYCWLACISWNRKSCQIFFNNLSNLLIPKHCASYWNIGIEGERPSVQKASFCVQKASFRVQNGRIRALSKPAPFFPTNICLECFGGHHHPIQPILSQPFSDLQSRDGQESVQMDQKRHHGF